MIGTFVVDKLFFREKSLAAFAIQAGVFVEVDIALVIDLLQNTPDGTHMFLIRRPDEGVWCYMQMLPGIPEHGAYIIDIGAGTRVVAAGGLDYFVAMFIGSRLKTHPVAA